MNQPSTVRELRPPRSRARHHLEVGPTRHPGGVLQGAISRPAADVLNALLHDAEGMTNTQTLPAQLNAAASSKQYSLTKILAIWASVTIPMGLLV